VRWALALAVVAAAAPASAGTRWDGSFFPNVPLTTHQGRTVRFFDDLLKDKVVVLSFIYTSCPDACPLETARLAQVQKLLGDRMGKDVFFYSISIDPRADTPAVLAAYARRHQAGPGWLFLTGAEADIKLIRTRLGLLAAGETGLRQHNLSLLMGNQATGQWMKRSPFENPYMLATQIGDWLQNWKRPPRPENDYARAPRLGQVPAGELLFRTRCAPCHLVGPDDGLTRSGPSLVGVMDRRDRPWLTRWLAEPDRMLAEKDPVAMQLYGSFNKIPMPNMRLENGEIAALIEYLDAQGRPRVANKIRPPRRRSRGPGSRDN
jgi:protein SCO1/2